jgi:prevent-host-death family protein
VIVHHLPIAGEVSIKLADAIAGGQPVVLTEHSRPCAVVIDFDSWVGLEESLLRSDHGASGRPRRRCGQSAAAGK